MDNVDFIGRKNELTSLRGLFDKKTASLAVIKGRRRVGKSRLAEEFARGETFYSFSGLPPDTKTTAESQREEFARQLALQFKLPGLKGDDWGDLFYFLSQQTQKGRIIILLDEISWMGSRDPNFLGKLKIAWDLYFKKNPKLILILCGSISSWIEKNILSSTGFFGRISLIITLQELSLIECNALLQKIGFKGSHQEKCMLLSITGGIPWYIELVNPGLPANENIRKLCFEPDGILVDEFKYIFHDLFGRRRKIYQEIVEELITGPMEYSEIAKKLRYRSSGSFSDYLEDLTASGYLSRDFAWQLSAQVPSKLSRYRLRDNYLRFYLKYIKPALNRIKKGQFKEMSISALPAWDSVMGLQFENLVLSNRALLHQKLGIRPEDIVQDNPFFQRKTNRYPGCQIDYMIETKLGGLYICEIKFSKKIISTDIISEMKKKIKSITKPKRLSCIPVLIHINAVSDAVEESGYFFKIIDFSELFNS